MPETRLDVLCIGNAIVDVIANATDDFLQRRRAGERVDAADRRRRGGAALFAHGACAAGQRRLRGQHRRGRSGARRPSRLHRPGRARPARRILPARPDLRPGVEFITPARRRWRLPTARSMILVTPDGHRTMNTFLGAAQHLPASALDEDQIRDVVDPLSRGLSVGPGDAALSRWSGRSRSPAKPDRKVAFTPVRHLLRRPPPRRLHRAARQRADRHPVRQPGRGRGAGRRRAPRDARSRQSKGKVETLVVTRSEDGALATRGGERADVPAEPVGELVDTTGAGDLFAAGFLFGDGARQEPRAVARARRDRAAEVIQHYGARPEADLRALAGELAA